MANTNNSNANINLIHPVKFVYDSTGNVIALSEYAIGDQVPAQYIDANIQIDGGAMSDRFINHRSHIDGGVISDIYDPDGVHYDGGNIV